MDNNPFRESGGGKGPGGIPGHIPSLGGATPGGEPHDHTKATRKPSNSNFESMPNDSNEQAFKVPGFGKAEDEEKKGLGNRVKQAEQAGKEIGSTLASVAGKNAGSGTRRPKEEEDNLTSNQREAVDTAKLGIKAAAVASALVGNEKGAANAAKEMAEHPIETAKEAKSATKFVFKLMIVGCLGCLTGIILLFAFISNFSQQHVSHVIKDVAFSPVDVTGARRVSQLLSETLFGDEEHFDVVKVLKNLYESDKISILKGDQTLTMEEFAASQSQQASGLTLVIGTVRLAVPANISDSSSAETIEFIKQLEIAIKQQDIFANEARIFRSPTAKQVYKQFGINLFRWENEGKDVKTYSDNMKSLYEKIKDLEQTDLHLKDVDESGKKLDEVTATLLDEELPRSQKSVAIKSSDIAWDQVTSKVSLNKFAQNVTSTQFAIASYCTAKSYINNYEKIVTQKFVNSQRAALKLLSSDDQVMVGKVNPKAVSATAQQYEFFEDARPYLKAINSDVTNRRPTLNEGQLAYQDPRIVKEAMEAIRDVFEEPFGKEGIARAFVDLISPDLGNDKSFWEAGWDTVGSLLRGDVFGALGELYGFGGNILDIGRDFMLDKVGELLGMVGNPLIGFIADRLYPILCEKLDVPDSGLVAEILKLVFGDIAQGTILDAVRQKLLDAGAYELVNQLGLTEESSYYSTPTENFMKFMYRTQKTVEYAGLDDGAELVSKDFEGVSALGNEISRLGGGRPLEIKDQLAFNRQKDERNHAVLKSKSLAYRLFSLENQYSPTSIVTARSPKSFSGAAKRTQTQFASIFSPVQNYGTNMNKTIASVITNKAVAQSLSSSDKYDRTVMFGYSVDELKKMHEDISFWPKQNKEYVEANLDALEEKFGMCFDPQNSIKILHDDEINMWDGECSPDKLTGDEALHYRLYLLDNLHTNSLTDLETVTQDPGSDSGPLTDPGNVGDVKSLAQQLLDNPNVTYPYTDTKGVNVRQVLEGVVQTGKGLVNSPDVDFNEVAVSARMLQALVEYAKTHPIGLNALTNADHSSSSNHYKGIAIDIACTPALDRAAFDAIVSQYGGTNNGEVCPDDSHWHYDFK